MRLKTAIAAATLLSLPIGSAMADTFWRNVMTSGATTASSYLTSRDHKLVVAAQDDASSFVASEGAIRGPFLEAAMREARAENPGMQASDMELANAILAKNAVAAEWSRSLISRLSQRRYNNSRHLANVAHNSALCGEFPARYKRH